MKKIFTLPAHSFIPGAEAQPQTLAASVARCTRCNACVQSCPSYLLNKEEIFSPRGRVQILRLILDRKIKYTPHQEPINRTMQDCILCGRCSLACAGQVPVAQQVLALKKAAALPVLPFPLKIFFTWHCKYPRLFDFGVRFIQRLRAWKLFVVRGEEIVPALRPIAHLHHILPRTRQTLCQVLRKTRFHQTPKKPEIIFFPSLEARYIDPMLAINSLDLFGNKEVWVWQEMHSGLAAYLLGDEKLCLQHAKALLTAWEKASGKKKLPFVTDSWEVFAFLKNYPSLFARLPGWEKRARAFAERAHFITDFMKAKKAYPQKTALDFSGLLSLPKETIFSAQKILKTHLGKNFVECEYSRFPVPAEIAALSHVSKAEKMILESVKQIASKQIKQVYCLSAWATWELNYALKKHYPCAQAKNIVYLQAKNDRI